MHKSFVKPHLDYEDTLYHKTVINSFHERISLIQYNTVLAKSGTIRGSSKEKLNQELGFESLPKQQW